MHLNLFLIPKGVLRIHPTKHTKVKVQMMIDSMFINDIPRYEAQVGTSQKSSGPTVTSNDKLVLKVIESFDSQFHENWNSLVDQPFCGWEWAKAWWDIFGQGNQLAVLVVQAESGQWVGMMPLYFDRSQSLTVLRSLSNGRACADHVRPLIKEGFEDESIELMAQWIDHQAHVAKSFFYMAIEGVDCNCRLMQRMLEQLGSCDMQISRKEIEGAWVAPLPSSWMNFQSSLRKKFRRKTNKAIRNSLIPQVDVITTTCPTTIQAYWTDFVRLHQARWNEKGESGCFGDGAFESFLKNAVLGMAENGNVAMFFVTHRKKVIGANLMLAYNNQAYLYQSGFDPEFSHLEPGHLLVKSAMEFSILNGLESFDFLRGDEPYKARWNASRVPMENCWVIPNNWRSRNVHLLWKTAKKLHSISKSFPAGSN